MTRQIQRNTRWLLACLLFVNISQMSFDNTSVFFMRQRICYALRPMHLKATSISKFQPSTVKRNDNFTKWQFNDVC